MSIHHASVSVAPLFDFIAACRNAGVSHVGLLRGLTTPAVGAARRLADEGIQVTSYSPVGYWASGVDADGVRRDLDDNLRALDEAAELGAPVVSVIAGPAAPRTPTETVIARVLAGLGELAPHAAERGLTLAIEALHPMFKSDRSALCTLTEAWNIVKALETPSVALNLDLYHVWWDPSLEATINAAAGRIAVVQLSDWTTPLGPQTLFSRGLPGSGVIDFATVLRVLERAGYRGPLEMEVLSSELLEQPLDRAISLLVDAYERAVLPFVPAERPLARVHTWEAQ